MRELILNHASVFTTKSDDLEILDWFKCVIEGIASVVNNGVAEKYLRMKTSVHEIPCDACGKTLHDLVLELQRFGYRDEHSFFVGLATKVPLLNELEEDIKDRFLAWDEQTLASEGGDSGDGEPLVFCTISDGISVGFPSKNV